MKNFLRTILLSLCISTATFILTMQQEKGTSSPVYIMGGKIGRYDIKIGVFTLQNEKPVLLLTQQYKTSEVTHFTDFLETVLENLKNEHSIEIKQACFGVPGNTSSDRMVIQAPHLDFIVDGHALIERKLLTDVFIINDFEVQGFALQGLDEKSIVKINSCNEIPHAPKMLVGAGAGLGTSLLVWQESIQNYDCLPFGGCFIDFMAHNPAELSYGEFIKQRLNQKKLSWGNILGSTGGIRAAYDYLGTQNSYNDQVTITDNQEIFTKRFLDQHCKDTVDLFMRFYARLIRNMIYAALPYGGLYISNTIALENNELFTAPEFMQEISQCNHEWLLENIIQKVPVYVITDPNIDIYGAAYYLLIHRNKVTTTNE